MDNAQFIADEQLNSNKKFSPNINKNKSIKNSNLLDQKMETYQVYVVTWNVGGKLPDNISLKNLFDLELQRSDEQQETNASVKCLPDIYAIGLQEVNVQPQHQVLGLFKDDPWISKTKKLLQKYDYVMVKSEHMQGLLLMIFLKRKHILKLEDLETEYTRTGFCGIWGNKGAISVRLTLNGCGLTFIDTHLTPHDHQINERIDDYKQIMEHHRYHVTNYRHIIDHDYVFWFGDLNFRLAGDETAAQLQYTIMSTNSWEELLLQDQLHYVSRVTKEAFQDLQEGQIKFPPTFKYKETTSLYDLKRRPAWTDRILYAIQPRYRDKQCRTASNKLQLEAVQETYNSHDKYCISDHKPVSSRFLIKLYQSQSRPLVEFINLRCWLIGRENVVDYRRPIEFEEQQHDWIGIFPMDYASFTDYIAYEYVNQMDETLSAACGYPNMDHEEEDPYFETKAAQRRRQQKQRLVRQNIQNGTSLSERQRQGPVEVVCLDFSSDIDLQDGEQYLLIYFQNTGLRGVTTIGGISNPFYARK